VVLVSVEIGSNVFDIHAVHYFLRKGELTPFNFTEEEEALRESFYVYIHSPIENHPHPCGSTTAPVDPPRPKKCHV
jgi:hypothetical protein